MDNAEKSGWQHLFIIFITFLTVLISIGLEGCSQQFTSASFTQKVASPVEIFPEVSLPEKSSFFASSNKMNIDRYLPLVKKYAQEYEIDWVLVLSIIKQESRFNYEAVSIRGAYGLMQIMPFTQIELAEKLGVQNTFTPRNNIKAGIYHLRSLYSEFSNIPREDRICLTLAAYNAGYGRIIDAQSIASYMGNDPHQWSSIRIALSFLSKKNYTLHSRIWNEGLPPSGYFKNWRQTIDYVDNVMKCYDSYSLALK